MGKGKGVRNIRKSRYFAAAVSAMLSFALHLVYLYENDWGAGFVSAYVESDAYYYFHKAWFSAFISPDGGMLGHVIPFSPYISLVTQGFKLFGPQLWVPFIVSALCIAGAVWMMVLIAERLFNPKVGWITGLLGGGCGVFIFYSGLTVKSGVVLLGAAVALYCSLLAIEKKSRVHFFLAVCVIALTAYERENIAVWVFPLLWFFAKEEFQRRPKLMPILIRDGHGITSPFCFIREGFRGARLARRKNEGIVGLRRVFATTPGGMHRRRKREVIPCPFLSIAGVLLVWWGARYAIDVLPGLQGVPNPIGVNFMVGNAPGANGGYTVLYGFDNNIIGHRLGVLNHLKAVNNGVAPGSWQFHTFMLDEWFRFYFRHPGDYLHLKLKHLQLLFSQYSYGHPEQFAFWRWENVSTAIAFIDWRWILSLSVTGLLIGCKYIKHNTGARFLFVCGLLYAFTVFVFLVTERYRLVLYIVFLPFAGYGVYQLAVNPNWRAIGIGVIVFSSSTLLNGVMEGPAGWAEDAADARAVENKNREKVSELYSHMVRVAEHGAYEEMVALARMFIKMKLYYDAKIIAVQAREKGEHSIPDQMIAFCNKMMARNIQTRIYQ